VISDLKSYTVTKDSGVEWLGNIPAHWEVQRLRTAVSILNGATPSTSRDEYWDGSIPWVTPDDLGALQDRRVTGSARKITAAGHASCGTSLAPQNSIVISTRAPIGHLAILSSPACTNQGCRLLVPNTGIKTEYLYEVLVSARSELHSLGQGTTFSELSRMKLGSFRVSVPPLSEQISIARFLNHANRQIERYIRAKEKLIALLGEQRQATIHDAVMGRIDVRTGKPYPEYRPSGAEWLGDMPAHWEMGRLKSLMANVVDQSRLEAIGGVFLAMEHVESWTGKLQHSERVFAPDSQSKRFQAGDILFGKLRPYLAKVARPETAGCCVGEFLVLRSRHERYRGGYAEYFLRSKLVIDTINSSTQGARMPRAEWTFIGNLPAVCPPVPEQTAIVRFLDETMTKANQTIDRRRREIDLLREYRTRLIADVVTGKLDVREAAKVLPDEVEEASA